MNHDPKGFSGHGMSNPAESMTSGLIGSTHFVTRPLYLLWDLQGQNKFDCFCVIPAFFLSGRWNESLVQLIPA